jgi:hypothetical protein
MQRRLGKLERVTRPEVPRQSGWDLSLLDDDALEELAVLAEKAEGTRRVGRTVVWNPAEEAVLARLGTKAHQDGGLAANVGNADVRCCR